MKPEERNRSGSTMFNPATRVAAALTVALLLTGCSGKTTEEQPVSTITEAQTETIPESATKSIIE